MKNLNLTQLVLGGILAVALSACGKIPENYRGSFQDAASGAKLVLEDSKGTLSFNDGRSVNASADVMKMEDVLAGKPGIYLRSKGDEKNYEAMFLFPNVATRKEVQGVVTFEGEVAVTRLDGTKKDKAMNISMVHCKDGQITVIQQFGYVEGGCAQGSDNFNFVRKE